VCAACAPQVQPIPRAPDVDLDLEDVDLADAVLGD
jgi:hypothetical protein